MCGQLTNDETLTGVSSSAENAYGLAAIPGVGMSGEAQVALEGRIAAYRRSGDARVLLEDRALVEVVVLRAAQGWPTSGPLPPGTDVRRGLDAAATAGVFLWLRSQELPQVDRLDDLLEAAELLSAVRDVAPRAVPRTMARTLSTMTGGRAGRSDHASVHDQAIEVLGSAARSGELATVDYAIMLLAAAVRSARGDRYEPYYLSDLGTAWLDRFRITGRGRDLENGLDAHEQALAEPVPVPEDQAGLLANYSGALLAKFEFDGGREMLEHAVVAGRMATELARSADQPPAGAGGAGGGRGAGIRLAQLASLSRLRAALLASYEQDGSEVDLDEAVQVAQEAASLAPAGDPAHLRFEAHLAHVLRLQATRRASAAAGDRDRLAEIPAPAGPPAAESVAAELPWRRTLTSG
jgi:hypothetical protein